MTALNDQLRLEILATTSGNAITNHSAQDGTITGWEVPAGFSGTLSAASGLGFGYSGKAFELVSTGTSYAARVLGEPFAIVGNQYANVAFTLRSAWPQYYLVYAIRFYDIAGTEIGHALRDIQPAEVSETEDTVMTLDVLSGNGIDGGSRKAPTGTTHARLDLFVGPASGGAAPDENLVTYLFDVMVVVGTSDSSVQGPVFSDTAETWQNLLPTSVSHTLLRGGDVEGVVDALEAAQLTSVLTDPAMTPENNDRVRPGRPIRLVKASDGSPLFTGKIVQARTSYVADRPRVTITATDAMADLQNYPQPVGKSGRFKQRVDAAMVDVPVNYHVTDSDTDSSSATISVDESGTALSQILTIRDSLRGLIYVDKANVVQCFANNSYPSQTPTVVLSDSASDSGAVLYLRDGIVTNFDSKNLVNALTVTKANLSEAGGSKVYGPYLNQDSVDEWGGVVSANLDVNDGDPATLAGLYLAVYDEPTIFVDEVTFNATFDIDQAVERELYEAATVKYTAAGVDEAFRVIGIEHTIVTNPDKWLVTLLFKPMEASSTITVTNPPGGAESGPQDLVPYTREVQSGVMDISFGGNSSATKTVDFTKPYENEPSVLAVGFNAFTSPRMIVQVESVSPTQATIRILTADGATHTGTRRIRWEAKPAT